MGDCSPYPNLKAYRTRRQVQAPLSRHARGLRLRKAHPNVGLLVHCGRTISWSAILPGTRHGLGRGSTAGISKHAYADRLLTRYQQMFGNRGLHPEVRYIDGAPWRQGVDPLKGSVRLDVVEGPLNNPTWVWDCQLWTGARPLNDQSKLPYMTRRPARLLNRGSAVVVHANRHTEGGRK